MFGRYSIVFFGPALVFIAAALWATDAPFRAHLTQGLSSNFIVLAEHAVSSLIAIPILLFNWGNLRKLSLREWLAVFAIAIGGSALASIAFTESFHYVNPSVSIVLQKVQPLIAIVLAVLLLMHLAIAWLMGLNGFVWAMAATFPALLFASARISGWLGR